ncbi:MAG: SpoIIE family protein phosphatase [Candidatus Omnitrophota bacterium]|nr:SpoIIE family protein phosphatase [Candidatus Omnitrophota bacterium]
MKNSTAQTIQDLRKVLSVTSKLNSTLDLDELLTVIMNTAAEVMRTGAASLMLVDEQTDELIFRVALGEKGTQLVEQFRLKMGEGIAGHVAQSGESVIVNEPEKDKRFARRFDKATGFKSKAIICVPMKAKDKIIGVLQALNPTGRTEFEQRDLDLFEVFADQAAIAVEAARLHSEILKQERSRQELKIAHDIQQNFLPELEAVCAGVDIAATSIPARGVGGDFYDVLKLTEDKIGVLVADVSGKGVPAALYMVRAICDYRSMALRYPAPSELLMTLNNSLVKATQFGMFITLLYMVLDVKNRELSYASAGHHPIIRSRPDAHLSEPLDHNAGVPLGLVKDTPYTESCISLSAGDRLYLYTDGIVEARNKKGEEYGMNRLTQATMTKHANAKDQCEGLIRSVQDFVGGAPQHDDMTNLVVMLSS